MEHFPVSRAFLRLIEPEIWNSTFSLRNRQKNRLLLLLSIVTQADAPHVFVKMREMRFARKNSSCLARQNRFHFQYKLPVFCRFSIVPSRTKLDFHAVSYFQRHRKGFVCVCLRKLDFFLLRPVWSIMPLAVGFPQNFDFIVARHTWDVVSNCSEDEMNQNCCVD